MNKKPRFFVGLEDPAGIGSAYTRALRKLGYETCFVTYSKHPFSYSLSKNDYSLGFERRNLISQYIILLVQFIKALFSYDIFIFPYAASFYISNNSRIANFDFPILKFFGKKIIVAFVGCDIKIRDDKKKQKISSCHPCTLACDKNVKKKLSEVVEKYADLVLSQKDYAGLLRKKYHPFWVPLNLEKYKPKYVFRKVPVIIHAPSNIDLKGTKEILKTINRLKKEGYKFDFRLLQGKKNKEVLEEIRNSDFVIDSLLGGWYGVFSAEAMALGKPVLGYLRPENLKKINVPMINTHPGNVYINIKKLIEMKPSKRAVIGKASRRFIEKYHSEDKIVGDILKALIQ